MATAAQGFLGGLTSGMQTTLGLLDSLEAKNRREVEAQQQALLFQQAQADRQWDLQNLRPLRLEDAQLGIKDKRSSVGYNQQLRPLLLQDKQGQVDYNEAARPLDLQGKRVGLLSSVDTLNHDRAMRPLLLDQAKDQQQYRKEDRDYLTGYQRPTQEGLDEWNLTQAKAAELRQQQQHNMQQGGQLASLAFSTAATDPQKALGYLNQADKLLGGQIENAANGMYSYTAALVDEVQTGKRSPADPEYQQAIKQVVQPTMKVSGRDKDYDFVGMDTLDDGRVVPLMQPKQTGKMAQLMRQAESSGNNQARPVKNGQQLSSAYGPHQFLKGTWLAQVRKHQPEWAKGKSEAQLLALRSDPAKSDEMTQRLIEDNFQVLKQQGVPQNATTAYLAHHFGAGRVKTLLNADPQTAASQVLTAQELKANPWYRGWSIGQVVDRAAKAMTVPATQAMSGDKNDPVSAISAEQAQQALAAGIQLEQQVRSLPEQIQARARALAVGSGVVKAEKTGGAAGEDWTRLNDKALFEKNSGRIKEVGGQDESGQMTLRGLLGGDFDPMDAEWKINLIEKGLKGVPAQQQLEVFSQVQDANSPAEVMEVLKPIQATQAAQMLVADLANGIDPQVAQTPAGQLLSQVRDKAVGLQLSAEELQRMAADTLATTGISTDKLPQAMALLSKRLDQVAAERAERAAQSANFQQRRQDNYGNVGSIREGF